MSKSEKKELEFYQCEMCGNLMIKLEDSGITPVCCGKEMKVVTPKDEEMIAEKHMPVWRMNGCKIMVQVGEILHPMEDKHYISWIVIETNKGIHLWKLCCEDDPELCIPLAHGEKVLKVYSYCNIHGLWAAKDEERYEKCKGKN